MPGDRLELSWYNLKCSYFYKLIKYSKRFYVCSWYSNFFMYTLYTLNKSFIVWLLILNGANSVNRKIIIMYKPQVIWKREERYLLYLKSKLFHLNPNLDKLTYVLYMIYSNKDIARFCLKSIFMRSLILHYEIKQ